MKIAFWFFAGAAMLLGCQDLVWGRSAAEPVPGKVPKEIYCWSLAENDIYSAAFSSRGTAVVLVTRFHWPDGHEAEDYPEDFFSVLEARAKKEPRFEDPVIHLLDETGAERCQVAYGWNPDLAPDGETIVFSAQVHPITGQCTLAKPLAGNQIQSFACRTRHLRVLAKPDSGYLDSPRFSQDGAAVTFTYNQPVNGDYGGAVGLGRVDVKTGQVTEWVSPEKTSAFYHLVSSWVIAPTGTYFIKLVPHAESGDRYLASSYAAELWQAGPGAPHLLRALGPLDWNYAPALQAPAGPFLLVFAETWKKYSPAPGAFLRDALPAAKAHAGVFSPDVNYCAVPEPGPDSGEDPESVAVYAAAGGRRVLAFAAHGPVRQCAWSRDSRRLAVIVSRLNELSGPGLAGRHLPHDELVVLAVP